MNHEDLSVTMTAGTTGTINANTMPAGSTSGWQEGYLRTMTINSAKSVVIGSGGIRLLSGFTCNAPVCISGSAKIDTTADGISTYGGNIVIQSVEGPGTITCKTGSGFTTTLGSVGKVTPLDSFTMGSSNTKSLTLSSVSTSSGDISISIPVTFTGDDVTLMTKGGNITLSSSVSFTGSNRALTLDAGSGSINVPTLPTFQSMSIAGSLLTIGSGLSSSGDITLGYSGTASINGNISAGGNFQDAGTGSLTAPSISAVGFISFSGNPTLNGTVTAGTSISCSGSLIAQGKLIAGTSFSCIGSLQLSGNTTLSAPDGINIGSQINTNGGTNCDLTLDTSTSSISIGGDVVNLHSFTISSVGEASLFNITTLGALFLLPAQL